MNQLQFQRLIDKYLEGTATEEEKQQLFRLYDGLGEEPFWDEKTHGKREDLEKSLLQRIRTSIRQEEDVKVVPFYRRSFFRVAAAVLLVAGMGTALWLSSVKQTDTTFAEEKSRQQPVPYVTGSAILTLADGRQVVLDKAADGPLELKGALAIRKEEGRIVYEDTKGAAEPSSGHLQFHTVSTGRGAAWQVVLPDGSRVWLNAASSLRYPVPFAGNERKVEVTGEVYFEVAKRKGKPFRVHAPLAGGRAENALIEVLGTHFNVNAYADESALTTTLLEGSVRVRSDNENEKVLSPGEQAEMAALTSGKRTIKVQPANIGQVMAWKANRFDFYGADIQTIMRQLSRWYDVQVVYEGKAPARSFTGKISRTSSLTTVLKILEQSNIRLRVEGNRIIVRS